MARTAMRATWKPRAISTVRAVSQDAKNAEKAGRSPSMKSGSKIDKEVWALMQSAAFMFQFSIGEIDVLTNFLEGVLPMAKEGVPLAANPDKAGMAYEILVMMTARFRTLLDTSESEARRYLDDHPQDDKKDPGGLLN